MNLKTEEDLLMVLEEVPAVVHVEPIAEAVLLPIQTEKDEKLEEENAVWKVKSEK
ncbi:MAG: hypothetical protein IKT48_01365 [Anaerotignum sp.]|nr:hypothetical protein [Anaerotignum sp.]